MKIKMSPRYQKGLKRCIKRNWDINLLDKILHSYMIQGGFTQSEIVKYKDHALKGKWSGHREFHPKGRRHDWVVVYHIENNTLVLDDVGDSKTLVLDDTGSHDEVFGAEDFEC